MADKNELQEFLDTTGLAHLWGRLKEKLSGKEAAGAAAAVQENLTNHNTDTQAHNDLRLELKALADRINAALDSDDETLDELSEIVAYIKSNKTLIEAITTSKVNVSDIVNDLLTNVANKPLSAAQGVALKKLIDDMSATIPGVDTALSDGSTNPVQNKVVAAALAGKAPTQFVMTLTVGDNNSYTIDKTFAELEAAIQAGSQIRLVDTSGMEYVLVAFAAGYMAYFAHRLNSARHLIGFRYNNTIIYTSETPYTTSNKPKPEDIGAAAASHGDHVPAGGTSGQILRRSADGTAEWVDPEGGVLVAQYGVTTFDEINTAVKAGKNVVCYYNDMYLHLTESTPDMFYVFYGCISTAMFVAVIDSETGWNFEEQIGYEPMEHDHNFLVTFTGTASSGITSDKTLSEISTAYNDGLRVYAKDSEGRVYNLAIISSLYAQFTSAKASEIASVLVITDGTIDATVQAIPKTTKALTFTYEDGSTETVEVYVK